jgi:hypothetical protein
MNKLNERYQILPIPQAWGHLELDVFRGEAG